MSLAAIALGVVGGVSVNAPAPVYAESSDDVAEKKKQAIELAKMARSRARDGKFALAAKMYLKAYDIDASNLNYLYSAARCQHLGGQLGEAHDNYLMFLRAAPKDHKLRPKVQAQFSALRLEREAADQLKQEGRTSSGSTATVSDKPPAGAEKTPSVVKKDPSDKKAEGAATKPVAVVKKPATPAEKAATMRLLGYIGGGAGVAVMVYGIYSYAGAFGRKSDLEASLDGKNASTLAQKDEAKRIEADLLSGGAVLTTGVLIAAVGAALIVLHPEPDKPKVSLLLTSPRSAALEVRF